MSLEKYEDRYGETFKDKVTGKVWGHRFDMVFEFEAGYAVVKLSRLDNNSYTLVDEHGRIWKQRKFANIKNSYGDSVLVQLKNGLWACADKKTGKLGKERFKFAKDFEGEIAKVVLKDNRYIYLNADGVECPGEYVKELREIYYHPKTFLDLPEERFADKKFIYLAVSQIRFSLNSSISSKEKYDAFNEGYIERVKEFLSSIKEKIRKAYRKVQLEKDKKKLLEEIKTLGV